MKYQMAYSRKVQAAQYEPIGMSLSVEFDSEKDMTLDEAHRHLKGFVDGKLQDGLNAMGSRKVIV